ncbi:hypothetical protein MJO29_006008 [Puccinia striiformis f. sp. tritici]|nr:hypothetical protein MJO29_006008 [Puccinia striiformis f. sp. tritici]
MLSHCKEHPGTYILPGYQGVTLSTRQRATLPIVEDDAPLNTPLCLGLKNRPTLDDCGKAFTGLRTDGEQNFVDYRGDRANYVANAVKSCKVVIMSTDGSVLTIKKQDAAGIAYRTVAKCNLKIWGRRHQWEIAYDIFTNGTMISKLEHGSG